MHLAGCQFIEPIDVDFDLQKSLEIFDKNSADKIWSKKDKEEFFFFNFSGKVSPLMQIKVNNFTCIVKRTTCFIQVWFQPIVYWLFTHSHSNP